MRWLAGLVAAASVLLVAPVGDAAPDDTSPGAPAAEPVAEPAPPVDPLLQETVDQAAPGERVTVEVLTDDTDATARAARALGAVVTGRVPGEVVQVSVPAERVDDLAELAPATYLRLPERVQRVDPRPEAGMGVPGEQVGVLQAGPWHDAGLRGAVKVGIVDFFDMAFWNPAEHGPAPSVANGRMFCRDSGGFGLCNGSAIDDAGGDVHGVAVAEVIKDVAPDAELYIATTGTISDLVAAIDWFAANGVYVVNRSLGSAYDGPGDGTGPLATVVNYAASRGIVWFNSAGNDAAGRYLRITVPTSAPPNSYIDLDPGPDVITSLRVDADPAVGCVLLDGIRWATDWYLPPAQRSNYEVEFWRITGGTFQQIAVPATFPDAQGVRPFPLRGANAYWCLPYSVYLRIRLAPTTTVGSTPDVLEIATAFGTLERSTVPGSAAKSVVDSANPSLVAVGAVHPNPGDTIAYYSSQGPTNDGRIKPDMAATSCITSTIYAGCFAGTSASSPTAAGVAALLLAANLAVPGPPLAALTKHLVVDLGAPGRDNQFGSGLARLPVPPGPVDSSPGVFQGLATPTRILDTRPASPVGPAALQGPHPQHAVIDVPLPPQLVPADATAVVVNVTSVDSLAANYVQALPTLRGQLGGSSTLNLTSAGQIRANMAIIPIGEGRTITVYLPVGGHLVVDLSGSFVPVAGATQAGRVVPIEPRRVLDTRPDQPGPVPTGWVPHKPAAGESVRVELPDLPGVPRDQIGAVVVNVVAVSPNAAGWLRAVPTGAQEQTTSTVNYVAGTTAAGHAVVPLGPDGTISVVTFASAHLVVDLVGYVTSGAAPSSTQGRFVPVRPGRAHDSRTSTVHQIGSTRTVQLADRPDLQVPPGAGAVALNLTIDQASTAGYVTVYPSGLPRPATSNINFLPPGPIANASLLGVSALGRVDVFAAATTHVIIDVNGYFTGAP